MTAFTDAYNKARQDAEKKGQKISLSEFRKTFDAAQEGSSGQPTGANQSVTSQDVQSSAPKTLEQPNPGEFMGNVDPIQQAPEQSQSNITTSTSRPLQGQAYVLANPRQDTTVSARELSQRDIESATERLQSTDLSDVERSALEKDLATATDKYERTLTAKERAEQGIAQRGETIDPETGERVLANETQRQAVARAAADATGKMYSDQVSNAPKPSEPGEDESVEEMLRRKLSDAEKLAAFYESQDAMKGDELKTVSGQVADFGLQLEQFKNQNQQAIESLNSQVAGLGDRVASEAAKLGNQAVDISNPDVQAEINKVANDPSISLEEQNKRIGEILSISSATVDNPATPSGMTDTAQPMNQFTPDTSQGQSTAQIEQQAIANDISNFYAQPSENMSTMVDFLKSTGNDGSSFTSADMSLMKLNNAMFSIDKSQAQLTNKYNQRKSRIMNDIDFYNGYWADKKSTGIERIQSAEDRIQRRLALQEENLLSQKEDKAKDLSRKTERYESFAKAQMHKLGVPVAGQAGMTMLFNSMANWNDSVEATLSSFDEKIQAVHDKQIDIAESYLDKVITYSDSIDEKHLSKLDELSTKWDEIEQDELLDQKQSDTLRMQAFSQFFTDKSTEIAAKEQRMFEAQQAAQERMWDVQSEAIKADGGIPVIGPDGQPAYMTDGEGNKVKNADQIKSEFEMEKYYNTMREVTMKQDSETGEWIGFDKFGNKTNYGMLDPGSGTRMGGFDMSAAQDGQTMNVGGVDVTIGGTYGPKEGNNSECVGGARLFNPSLPSGLYTLEDKLKISNDGINSTVNGQPNVPIRAGSTVFFDTGMKPGHAAHVTKLYTENGIRYMDVIETNLQGDNKWGVRTRVPVNSAAGFYTDPSGGGIAEAETRLTKTQKKDLVDLNKQFSGRQEVQEYREAESAALKVLATGGGNPAGDLAVVFNFMKTLDPGSTVREGEFANAQNSAGVPEILRAKFNQIMEGTRLSPAQRKDFLQTTVDLLEAQRTQFDPVVQEFRELGRLSGIPEDKLDNIVGSQSFRTQYDQPQLTGTQQKIAFDTGRNNIIDAIRAEDPNTNLTDIANQLVDTQEESDLLDQQFTKFFGPNWKTMNLDKVNAVNIADTIMLLEQLT